MSYFVYKTETEVLDPALLADTNPATALAPNSPIVNLIFEPSNIKKYTDALLASNQVRVKRYLVDNTFVTERVFATEQDANSLKSALDEIYASNELYMIEQGNIDKFNFRYFVYEISDQEFINGYVT